VIKSKTKMRRWQFQTAKAKLSEVVDTANRDGPQAVTRRGKLCAYIVSPEDFEKTRPADMKLSELFRPLAGLKIERSRELPRPAPDFSK
jgi:prevent-host-death family protein